MLELIDTQPDANVQESEYARLLGYPPNHVLDGRPRELADLARQWYAEHGRPWIYARHVSDIHLSNERLNINDVQFSSKLLHDQFAAAHADAAMLVVVSAGSECEEKARELWQEGKPDEYFFMEMFGSAVVEYLITVASGRICGWADQNHMVALPHYSPGYSGWNVADQIKLWNLIQQNGEHALPGGLDVLDTGMLRPKKSLLAVIGITRHLDRVRGSRNLIPCESCSLSRCQYRRAPYKHSMPQIEDVHRLQASLRDEVVPKSSGAIGAIQNARYSVNVKALEKWSQERLQLKTFADGSVEAVFRYEGTTCANLGHPLEFHYRVRLGSQENGYVVEEAVCGPAPEDVGHSQQCEFLINPDLLMQSIASEKPLLGKPLDDIFAWQRAYNPSGCYCDSERRAHKWGLAYEVIHYALAQRSRKQSGRQPAEALK